MDDLEFGPMDEGCECDECNVPMMANCQSCGMPMVSEQDFGGGNRENACCVHCCNADGTLKSFEEVAEGMARFMMQSQGMDSETARRSAREYLSQMPAWAGRTG